MSFKLFLRRCMPKLQLGCRDPGCEIPRPFWWPQAAGCVTSHVCRGGVAVLELCVRNTGPEPRDFEVDVAPNEAMKRAVVEPPSFALGPMEEQRVIVRYTAPASDAGGCGSGVLVWVRGCLNQYLEWNICMTSTKVDSCHEVCVRDEPPYTLEWYHHFYCEHPCIHELHEN